MTEQQLEQRRKDAETIQCFGFRAEDLRCSALRDVRTSLERCMSCKFRKPDPQVTGGVRYPVLGDQQGPRVALQRGKLRFLDDDGDEKKKRETAPARGEAPQKQTARDRDCISCAHSSAVWRNRNGEGASELVCAYILDTGHRRPCEAGKCRETGVYVPVGGARLNGFKKNRLELRKNPGAAGAGNGDGWHQEKDGTGTADGRENGQESSEGILELEEEDDMMDPSKDPDVARLIRQHAEERHRENEQIQ